ncbi:hypothetical protein BGX30_012910, partial [Mortierella sp. GBA39]
KHTLERRAPGDNATHPGVNTSNGTGTGARKDGTTATTTEEEEAEAARKAAKEATRKAAEEEASKKKTEEEEAAREKTEEEAKAEKKAEEEEAARKAAEEEAAKKAAEEEAKKKVEEQEAARKVAEKEAKKKAEEEAAKRAAEEAEAARRAKEEADRRAAVEEAARNAKGGAEMNEDKGMEYNKGTAHDKDNKQKLGEVKDNETPDQFEDGTMTKGDSTISSKTTIMIVAIGGSAALVVIIVTGFIIRHRQDVSRRASVMEAYLGRHYRQCHYGDYHTVSPVLVQKYVRDKLATETTIDPSSRPSPTFISFLFPAAVAPPSGPLVIDTSSKESFSTDADPVSASLASPLPRDPHSFDLLWIDGLFSASRNSASEGVAGMKSAKGSFKRSPVEALIASETGSGANGEQSLRRSGSVLFE